MAKRKAGFYWHVHHDILMEWCYDYQERLDFIKSNKPQEEQELRIKLFKSVKGKLPLELIKAAAAWDKAVAARAACDKVARAAYDKAEEVARAAYKAAWKAEEVAEAAYDKARTAVWVANDKAVAACKDEIEALHKKECPNCSWNGTTIFQKGN